MNIWHLALFDCCLINTSSGFVTVGSWPMSDHSLPLATKVAFCSSVLCPLQDLRELFSSCGEVKYAEMKERGTGMVRFNSERDAERAVGELPDCKVARFCWSSHQRTKRVLSVLAEGSSCSTAVKRTPRIREVVGSIPAGCLPFFSFYPQ